MLIEIITIHFFYIHIYYYFSSKTQGVIVVKNIKYRHFLSPKHFYCLNSFTIRRQYSAVFGTQTQISIMKSTNCEQRLNFDFKNIFCTASCIFM